MSERPQPTLRAALDVHYRAGMARAVCVSFAGWGDERPSRVTAVELPVPAAYRPGRFFERELPCLLAVLEAAATRFDVVVIDGFVHLQPPLRGLGVHLADSLSWAPSIIGVAKSPLAVADRFIPLLRGRSTRPLLISAVNCPLELAWRRIGEMHGRHRVPTLLREADRLSRAWRG